VDKVVKLLQGKAQSLHSNDLAALASRVKASPFAAVADMIKGLIAKKQAQGTAETTKQAWCEGELSSNKATRNAKTEEVEGLQAGVEKLQATIKQIGNDVVDLNQQVSEMQTAMSEATGIRQTEKKENVATIADAKAAQAAVAQALGVLNEFYAKAGQATALVQTSSVQPAPVAFSSKPYTGMGSESGGVIGMIEVIQSDFARLETETTTAEQAAAKEYETFMSDSKLDVAGKKKDVEHKTDKAESMSQKMNTMQLDLGNVQKELDAANQAFEVLKPQCADATASYQEQKAQREEEMNTLQQALDALNAAR
jgi:chromosome segregation ATPase